MYRYRGGRCDVPIALNDDSILERSMATHADLVLVETSQRVATLTMNNPRRLNGWTTAMQAALADAMARMADDADVAAVVLTGAGSDYYSAGADLSGTIRLGHPKTLHGLIEKGNYRLFDQFIQFPKPILAAVNGNAIGAPVTSATLCDAIIASERASFRTPFARLGVPPEGCSSVHLPRLIGETAADRMLGQEGWAPTAPEALEVGLVDAVVPPERLREEAQKRAEAWVAEGRPRTLKAGATKEELMAVNARESKEVADAFLSAPFLMGQYRFLKSKKKTSLAMTFLALRLTRPAWSLLL